LLGGVLVKVPHCGRNKQLDANVAFCEVPVGQCGYRSGGTKMANQGKSLGERLSIFAEDERRKAMSLPAKDQALRKIRQAETASHLAECASSPALKPLE
jgi:hypothetical protein